MNHDVFLLIVMPSLYYSVHVVSKDNGSQHRWLPFNVDLQIDHSPRHQNICVGWIVTHVEHAYGSLDLLAITHPHSNSSWLIAVVKNYQNT